MHHATGVDYWLVILGSTLVFRLTITPLLVMSMQQAGKMEALRPNLQRLQSELRMAGGYKNREAGIKFQTEWTALRKQHGFSMLRQFAPILVQIPAFLWFFTAVRYLITHTADMATGGALWFVDLSATDPFLRLNLVTAATMFLSFKLGAETGQQPMPGPMASKAAPTGKRVTDRGSRSTQPS